jgi:ribonuclease P protein component
LTHHQTLSKSERLKSYKRIRILFTQGQKFKVFPLVVYFLLRDELVERRLREVTSVEGGEEARRVEGVEDVKGLSLPTIGVGKPDEGMRGEGVLQMGVSVGKRHFKRAVDRNLLKRRIREAYRKQKGELKETLSASGISMDIFFVYSNARISDYSEIETAMASTLVVLIDKLKKRLPGAV